MSVCPKVRRCCRPMSVAARRRRCAKDVEREFLIVMGEEELRRGTIPGQVELKDFIHFSLSSLEASTGEAIRKGSSSKGAQSKVLWEGNSVRGSLQEFNIGVTELGQEVERREPTEPEPEPE
eukprot:c24942_g3_i1 orf=2-364(-)